MKIRDRKFTTQAATQLKLKAVLEEDVEWGDFAYHGLPEGPDAHVLRRCHGRVQLFNSPTLSFLEPSW